MKATIVTRLRFIAAIAPVILLIGAAIVVGGFYTFGQGVSLMNEREVAGLRAAQGMDTALYKIQWGRAQPDGQQIVFDQHRAFTNWLDFAQSRIDTEDQRNAIIAIGNLAPHLFSTLKSAAPEDLSVEPMIDRMHGLVANLKSADEGSIAMLKRRSAGQARVLMIIALIVMVVIPWACYAALAGATGKARGELRAARKALEELSARLKEPEPAVKREIEAISGALGALGFKKPNPMLADE